MSDFRAAAPVTSSARHGNEPARDDAERSAGPLDVTHSPHAIFRPAHGAAVTSGFWQKRRRVNAEVGLAWGAEQLVESGNVRNLRLAAGMADGEYRGDLPFLDSDVYKWLEAVAWQLAKGGAPDPVSQRLDEFVDLLSAAQAPDGYLQSYFQVLGRGERYADLQWGHELYCAGHLIQAGVALARTTGRTDLLDIARRFADHIDAALGPGRREAVEGHPEIETALVELYRQTGERPYLALASTLLDRRGRGLLGDGRFGRAYWQDHIPLREAHAAAGHAVRQLYLLAGAVDVYLETGDPELLGAAVRLWEDIVANKTYLTGGMGSRHIDESFGDPYELPSDRAYAETCAAIASIMLSWRLLIATGDVRYADFMERTLYNGFLSGVSLDGRGYRYTNPLHVRDGRADPSPRHARWFRCACCPPNVMRLLASLPHYFACTDGSGLVIHQYASGEYRGASSRVEVRCDYPWSGRVELVVRESAERPWTLTVRIPSWCSSAAVAVNGEPSSTVAEPGWVRLTRAWRVGDQVALDLDLRPRLVTPDPRIDAVRGCLAVERGPLLYCIESADQPGRPLDQVMVDGRAAARDHESDGGLPETTLLQLAGYFESRAPSDGWPYTDPALTGRDTRETITLVAIPYYAWGNRAEGSMRVWIRSADPPSSP